MDHIKRIRESQKTIDKSLKAIEKYSGVIEDLHAVAKTESGRLTEFGGDLIKCAKEHGLQQAFVARLLDISPGAVSQHYARHS